MGMRSALSMFAGSVFGWGIVGPMAQSFGWCNPVMDWQTGKYIIFIEIFNLDIKYYIVGS